MLTVLNRPVRVNVPGKTISGSMVVDSDPTLSQLKPRQSFLPIIVENKVFASGQPVRVKCAISRTGEELYLRVATSKQLITKELD